MKTVIAIQIHTTQAMKIRIVQKMSQKRVTRCDENQGTCLL